MPQALQEEEHRLFVSKKKSKIERTKVHRNIHVGFGKQLQESESILADDIYDASIDSSPLCGQELPGENFPEVVLFSGLGITKFQRCKGEVMNPPKDFICHIKALDICKDSN